VAGYESIVGRSRNLSRSAGTTASALEVRGRKIFRSSSCGKVSLGELCGWTRSRLRLSPLGRRTERKFTETEGEKEFVLAVWAADADEAVVRVIAPEKLVDGLFDDRPPEAEVAGVAIGIDGAEVASVRAERVIAGQAKARAEGKTWGGSEKRRRVKVTDEQVTLIRRLRREGESVSSIARATNLTRPTVYSYLPS
jgi:hypothetical protein